jgi:hypothetical protein
LSSGNSNDCELVNRVASQTGVGHSRVDPSSDVTVGQSETISGWCAPRSWVAKKSNIVPKLWPS